MHGATLKLWYVVDLLRRNLHWWSPIIPSACGVNLDSRMLDKIFYTFDKSDLPLSLLVCFITMINSFHSSGSSSLFQIELISSDLRVNCSTPWFNQFCWVLINTRWFVSFYVSVGIPTSEALGSGISDSGICISVCWTSLTLCTIFQGSWLWYWLLSGGCKCQGKIGSKETSSTEIWCGKI
jgi:hypothetical protein